MFIQRPLADTETAGQIIHMEIWAMHTQLVYRRLQDLFTDIFIHALTLSILHFKTNMSYSKK